MAKVLPIKPSRTFPNANVIHGIRCRVAFAPDPAKGERGAAAGRINIGTLPAGAMVLPGVATINTPAFTSGATFDIGQDTATGGTANAFMATATIAPGTAGVNKAVAPTLGYVAVDTPVYLTIGGTAVATGSGDFLLQFYPPKD
jgi:hypothetical protein